MSTIKIKRKIVSSTLRIKELEKLKNKNVIISIEVINDEDIKEDIMKFAGKLETYIDPLVYQSECRSDWVVAEKVKNIKNNE